MTTASLYILISRTNQPCKRSWERPPVHCIQRQHAGHKPDFAVFDHFMFARAPRLSPETAPPDGLTDLFIEVENEVRIHALYHSCKRPEGSKHVLLYFHGNGEHVYDSVEVARRIAHHVHVLAISYRGFGKSDGDPSEDGIYRDAEAALHHLMHEKKFSEDEIFIYGRSLGSAVAIHIAQKRAYRGLILEAPFLSAKALAEAYGFGWVPLPGIATAFNSGAKAAHVGSRALFMHGDIDAVVPIDQGRDLFDAYGADNKQFKTVIGAGHNDIIIVAGDDYWRWVEDFLRADRA